MTVVVAVGVDVEGAGVDVGAVLPHEQPAPIRRVKASRMKAGILNEMVGCIYDKVKNKYSPYSLEVKNNQNIVHKHNVREVWIKGMVFLHTNNGLLSGVIGSIGTTCYICQYLV